MEEMSKKDLLKISMEEEIKELKEKMKELIKLRIRLKDKEKAYAMWFGKKEKQDGKKEEAKEAEKQEVKEV